MRIHQLGSVLINGDAVTNHIVEIDRRLVRWGFDTAIYGATVDHAPLSSMQPDSAYIPCLDNPDDVLIYHYSAYCGNYELFLRSRNRKVLVYHNITPAEFFAPYDATYEMVCKLGRRTLSQLTVCELAVGVSAYNCEELVAVGFDPTRVKVLPLFLGVSDFEAVTPNPTLFRQLQTEGLTQVLFVGKVAPNKGFEDLIKIFYAYHRYVNPHSRLILVGPRFLPRYNAFLDRLVTRLDLDGAVVFTGRIPLRDLRTYYEVADLFLCASKHEGFCMPLLEAMHFEIPILARAETGVPYTLGNAGVQYHVLDYSALAETMNLLVTDMPFRRQVLAEQKRRLQDFAPERVEDRLRRVLDTVVVDAKDGQ